MPDLTKKPAANTCTAPNRRNRHSITENFTLAPKHITSQNDYFLPIISYYTIKRIFRQNAQTIISNELFVRFSKNKTAQQ
jgi:hypothetical protein